MSVAAMHSTNVELDGAGGVRFLSGMGQDAQFATVDEARQSVIDHMTAQAVEAGGAVRVCITDPAGNWRLLVYPDGHVEADTSPADDLEPESVASVPQRPARKADRWGAANKGGATAAASDPALASTVETAAAVEEPTIVLPTTAPVAEAQPVAEAEAEAQPVADALVPVSDGTGTGWEPVRATQPATALVVPTKHHSFLTATVAPRPAELGWRGALNMIGGFHLAPDASELAEREDVRTVAQHWVGPRTIVVVNGKGGTGKTPTSALLSAVLARCGGGGVVAWDVNQLRGTLGWRTEQGPHDATVLDLVPALQHFSSASASFAELGGYVHHQTEDRYDVLRSQPLVLADEQRLHPWVVKEVWEVLTRYYRVVVADTGNDESDPMWKNIVARADQIVVATTTLADRAEAGLLLLDALRSQNARGRALAENAVVVVSQADRSAKKVDVERIQAGFAPVARDVVHIPFDAGLVDGQLRWSRLNARTQRAWLAAGAAVARGL